MPFTTQYIYSTVKYFIPYLSVLDQRRIQNLVERHGFRPLNIFIKSSTLDVRLDSE